MKILAIETSCDETSLAIIETNGTRRQPRFRVLSHIVSSQIKLHAKFGGVVPNLARREHQRLLVPLLLRVLKEAKMNTQHTKKHLAFSDAVHNNLATILEREPDLLIQCEKNIFSLPIPDIDVITVTNGPGLAPALWVGVNFAKVLALVWKKPIIPMNHMKGHLYAGFISDTREDKKLVQFPRLRVPLLALLVSGGHTELVLMRKFGNYEIIGETLDDAVGEAFDKVARMLGLGYPGGHAISAIAEKKFKIKNSKFSAKGGSAFSGKINLPRPMMTSNNYNFSFSGLKTSVLYLIRDIANKKSVHAMRPAIAKEFQNAAVDVLVAKTVRAAKEYGVKIVVVGGGVSANNLLRERLSDEIRKKCPQAKLFIPHSSLTGDNALMIALAAVIDGRKKTPNKIGVEANMRIDD